MELQRVRTKVTVFLLQLEGRGLYLQPLNVVMKMIVDAQVYTMNQLKVKVASLVQF